MKILDVNPARQVLRCPLQAVLLWFRSDIGTPYWSFPPVNWELAAPVGRNRQLAGDYITSKNLNEAGEAGIRVRLHDELSLNLDPEKLDVT